MFLGRWVISVMLRISLEYQLRLSEYLKSQRIPENAFFAEVDWTAKLGIFDYDQSIIFVGVDNIPVNLAEVKEGIYISLPNYEPIRAAKNKYLSLDSKWRIDAQYQKKLYEYIMSRGLDAQEFFSHIIFEEGWSIEDNAEFEIYLHNNKGKQVRVSTTGIRRFLNRKESVKALLISTMYKNIVDYYGVELGISMTSLYKHIEWAENYEFECRQDEIEVQLRNGEQSYMALEEFKALCLGQRELEDM